ncbi:unnamed protein product [Rhizoctonia solani]|uniref:Protein kinase domain-containing protein n=1 Tax=Rhizoctonia solani TaxID=456999 RepID=A0A8H3BUY0_9AGAM|nr:unnamed protein product [Rhizoctonia solani]CAE6464295.1 unnamed protein product [Rhizoctonia solani]
MSQVAIMGPQPPTLSLSDASNMTLAQVAAGLASVPDVNSLLEVLKDLFVAVEKVAVNRDQWKILRGRCVMVAYISISYVMSNQKAGYPTLPNATEHLQWTIKGIIRTVDHWQRNYHAQFFDTTDCVLVGHAIVEQFSVLDTYLANYIPFDADATALPLQELQAAQRNAVEWLEYLKYHSRATVESGPGQESDRESDRLSIPLLEIEVERRHRIFQNPDQKTVAEYVAAEDFLQVIQNVTDIQLPPTLLTGRQCVQLSPLPIRSGIHCDVYKASFLNGLVAKKVFRLDTTEKSSIAKYSEKLVEDAKLWAKFRSAYTLPFYGVGMETVGRDKVQLYMVSPLMKNLDAASYLKTYRNNPNMREGVMRIITDAAAGLKYLHGLNPTVVHSGMRGENILVTDSGGGLLGGFAFTKELLPGASGDTKPVTDAPQAVLNGKVDDCRWMAPETLSSSGLVLQTSSDVWRWAMTALELITGRLPYYETKDPKVVIDKVISKKLPARVDYTEFETHSLKPDDMWRLLESCWTYMPEDRPTIDKVIEKLQEISSPKKISAAGSNVMQATGSETWIQQFPDIDWDLCEPDDPDAIPESYLVYLKTEQDRDLHIKQMEDSAKEYHTSGEKIYVVEHRFHGAQPQTKEYRFQPRAEPTQPQDVDVYVVDSGVLIRHTELDGHALWAEFSEGAKWDVSGHGTRVAAVIAGRTLGVCPNAKIWAVQVDRLRTGTGTGQGQYRLNRNACLVALDRIIDIQRRDSDSHRIINLSISFSGGNINEVERLVTLAIASGIHVCAAAGNVHIGDNNPTKDARRRSPGRLEDVITVAGSDIQNRLCDSSYRGPAVTIIAPGGSITTASHRGADQEATVSGTSYAAPHVSGVAASILRGQPQAVNPRVLRALLVETATPNILINVPNGTVNRLLNNGAQA